MLPSKVLHEAIEKISFTGLGLYIDSPSPQLSRLGLPLGSTGKDVERRANNALLVN